MVDISSFNPQTLSGTRWRELQSVEYSAFAATLKRSPAEIDELVNWNDRDAYFKSHVDPNTEVGRRLSPNQDFASPAVAVATESGNPVGFAYSARNVSGGSELLRTVKAMSIVKNYLWIRTVVVLPEYHRQGIATNLLKVLLDEAISFQPVAAYVWPEEDGGFAQTKLTEHQFRPTGSQNVEVFGKAARPVKQVRMEAKSVRAVLKQLGSST